MKKITKRQLRKIIGESKFEAARELNLDIIEELREAEDGVPANALYNAIFRDVDPKVLTDEIEHLVDIGYAKWQGDVLYLGHIPPNSQYASKSFMENRMEITKSQLTNIIREAISSSYAGRYRDVSSHGGPAGRGSPINRGSIYNTDRRGINTDLESEVRAAYRSGRSAPQGVQTQGIVDELFMMKNEPENFSMEKDEFIQSHERYSPDVPKEHIEFLWNYYMVLGREL